MGAWSSQPPALLRPALAPRLGAPPRKASLWVETDKMRVALDQPCVQSSRLSWALPPALRLPGDPRGNRSWSVSRDWRHFLGMNPFCTVISTTRDLAKMCPHSVRCPASPASPARRGLHFSPSERPPPRTRMWVLGASDRHGTPNTTFYTGHQEAQNQSCGKEQHWPWQVRSVGGALSWALQVAGSIPRNIFKKKK